MTTDCGCCCVLFVVLWVAYRQATTKAVAPLPPTLCTPRLCHTHHLSHAVSHTLSTHPDAISPCASASGLPHSMVMMVARSLRDSRMRSYHLVVMGVGVVVVAAGTWDVTQTQQAGRAVRRSFGGLGSKERRSPQEAKEGKKVKLQDGGGGQNPAPLPFPSSALVPAEAERPFLPPFPPLPSLVPSLPHPLCPSATHLRRMAPLSLAVVFDHWGNTACAAAMAVSVSSAFILGTVASTLPVAGLVTCLLCRKRQDTCCGAFRAASLHAVMAQLLLLLAYRTTATGARILAQPSTRLALEDRGVRVCLHRRLHRLKLQTTFPL